MNNCVLVGRLVSDPQINETENGNKNTSITLAVQRNFKNMNGEYETDFIPCMLWGGVATPTADYCKKGDVIGVKGRLQTKTIDGKVVLYVTAEKVTFLSSKKVENEEV